MLLVNHAYPSYEVSREKHNCFIHVKVAKFRGTVPWHFISAYLPSGGSRRSERTQCLCLILKEYETILEKEPAAMVAILGDFNLKRELLKAYLQTQETALTCLEVKGDGLTFHHKGTTWSDVDNILVSPGAKPELSLARVDQSWMTYSDHFPLMAHLVPGVETITASLEPRYWFNIDLVKGHGKAIVNKNWWSVLPVDPIEMEEDLNETAEQFCSVVNVTAMELGIKQQVLGGKMYLNRSLKKKMEKVHKERQAWEQARLCQSAEADKLL